MAASSSKIGVIVTILSIVAYSITIYYYVSKIRKERALEGTTTV